MKLLIFKSTQISFVPVDDEIVELNESVIVQFVHSFIPYINFLESRGEFLRDSAIVDIIDNDCKYFDCIFPQKSCIMTMHMLVV